MSFVLFGHENGSSAFLQKPYQTWQTAVKALKKKLKCSNNNTQKESNIITKIFR